MNINLRKAIGLALVIVALVMVPTGWAYSRILWVAAFVFFVVGIFLFYTERMHKREEQIEKEASARSSGGTAVPTDIHNYTGWRSGSRSESFESSESSGADGD
jgi:hypothetical protein